MGGDFRKIDNLEVDEIICYHNVMTATWSAAPNYDFYENCHFG